PPHRHLEAKAVTRSQFLAGVFVVALFTRASVTSAQHDRPSAGSQQSLWGPGAGRTSTTTSTLTQLALELRELVPESPSLFAVAELQAELSSVQAAELGKRLHQ